MSDIWMFKGPSFVNCNCDWGCPCQFNAMPTHGSCHAVSSMHIDEGYYRDVRLDGLEWVNLMKFPGAVHEGNGSSQVIIDERADEAQRSALLTILSGQDTDEGSTIFNVFAPMVTTAHEPLFLPIEFESDMENRTARVRVPQIVEISGTPIRNPITGDEHRATIGQPDGFEFTLAEMGSGTTQTLEKAAVELHFEESYGQFSYYHMTNHGVVR